MNEESGRAKSARTKATKITETNTVQIKWLTNIAD